MHFAPRRELGRTGFIATAIGAGDLADRALGLDACAATLRRALEVGVNLVDTAPAYEDGFSEQVVGRALAGRRGGVFVVDKIDHFDRPVGPQVSGSLERLGFSPDAFVLHGVSAMDDWERHAQPGGHLDQLAREVQAGRCRFIGVSSHDPDVARAAILSARCDLVMFAVGPHVDGRYTRDLLPLARERRVGTVCFKTFGAGMLVAHAAGYGRPLPAGVPARPLLTVDECIRATLTFDPDVALLGLSTPEEQGAAFGAVSRFACFTRDELDEVCRRAEVAAKGKGVEWWNPPSSRSSAAEG